MTGDNLTNDMTRYPCLPIAAILVSFNTREMTLRSIRDLLADPNGVPSQIVVVDNASKDGSAAAVRQAFPEVLVIENSENRGFGAANNVGMTAAMDESLKNNRPQPDAFLLINTDAFVHPEALLTMWRAMQGNPNRGVVGPALRNPDGSRQRSVFGFPTPMVAWIENLGFAKLTKVTRFNYQQPAAVDFVSGACMMVSREAYDATGGFDENFFLYSEETDWQRRIRSAGFHVWFTPTAEVTHVGGGSQTAGKINPEFFRSIDLYQSKHHGWFGMQSFRLAMAVGAVWRIPPRWILARFSEHHAAQLKIHCFVLMRYFQPNRSDARPVQDAFPRTNL